MKGKYGVLKEQYTYSQEGRLVSYHSPDGRKTSFQYNEKEGLAEVRYPGGAVRYGYDKNGNRIWMKDADGATEYYYDPFDRLAAVVWKRGPRQLLAYGYNQRGYLDYLAVFDLGLLKQESEYAQILQELDRDGSRVSGEWDKREEAVLRMVESLARREAAQKPAWKLHEVRYQWDILGRVTSVAGSCGTVRYSYDPEKRRVERALPNGITTAIRYLPNGSVASVRHEGSPRQLLSEYQYEYNAAGKVVRVREVSREEVKTTEYLWDSRGYLRELRLPNGAAVRYEYDAMGNRVMKEEAGASLRYQYDPYGRLVQAGEVRYEWDRDGNLVGQREGRQKKTLVYDGRRLLTSATTASGAFHYGWDGDGNLTWRRTPDAVTHYLSDPQGPAGLTIVESDRAGKPIASYLYTDVLLGQEDADCRAHYFLEDGFNSIRQVVDRDGRVVDERNFTPFVEPLGLRGRASPQLRTMGERLLPELTVYAIASRLYEPAAARYWTVGPAPGHIERFDSLNKYAHGCGQATVFSEPRCNQTKKRFPFVSPLRRDLPTADLRTWTGAIAAQRREPIDVFVTGIRTSPKELARIRAKEGLAGTISTSAVGQTPLPSWAETVIVDPLRAFLNYFGLPGGKTEVLSQLRAYQDRNPGSALTIRAYSNGVITIYNLRQALADDIKQGRLRVNEIRVAGAGLRKALQEFFDKQHINVPVVEENPANRFSDVFRLLTTPQVELSKELHQHPASLGRMLDGLWIKFDNLAHRWRELSDTTHHSIESNYPGLLDLNRARPAGPGGLREPFTSIEKQLGGVELSATGEFVGDIGSIFGAVYDPKRQCLVLVGQGNRAVPSLKAEDFAIAWRLAESSRAAQFSLDPADRRNPQGPWLKAVYMPEEVLAGTAFGKALFEADWFLKQYSFGVRIDEQGRQHERVSSVPGFKSAAQLALDEPHRTTGRSSWVRMWIVSDDMKLRQHGNSVTFDVAKMRVKAKKQVPDPNSRTGLRDVDTEDDPIATGFARLFTDLYDQLAQESPEFERVRELAKAVALAKWLKAQNVPVDAEWVGRYASVRIPTVDRIGALSVERLTESQTPFTKGRLSGIQIIRRQLRLFGGVDLEVTPRFISDNGKTRTLEELVTRKMRQPDAEPVFPVEQDGRLFQATVMPITDGGQSIWKERPSVEFDGALYSLNQQRKVTKRSDKNGNVSEYVYDSNLRLKAVRMLSRDGSVAVGERGEQGSVWAIKDPRGKTVKYTYGASGFLEETEVDGRKWAAYEFHDKDNKVVIRHGACTETITHDSAGNIREYRTQGGSGCSSASSGEESVSLEYSKSGRLAGISGTGVPPVSIGYAADGETVLRVTTPRSEVRYSYDAEGRIREVTDSTGTSVVSSYDGRNLSSVLVSRQGQQAEYRFAKEGMIYSRDFLGGVAEYGYTGRLLSSVKLGAYGEAKYLYDDLNRLREVRLPDGSWLEYRYQEANAPRGWFGSSPMAAVTVVTHPAPAPAGAPSRK
jgi:YD repeat-containing protein